MKHRVSAIIAARNEAPRIGGVLKVVCKHPLIDEVLVMADGCSDNTVEISRKYGAIVHERKVAGGKTLAIMDGIQLTQNDTILLLDADLQNLTSENVTNLLNPVINDQVDLTLSIRNNSLLIFKLFGIDFISGERAIKKEFLQDKKIWSRPDIGYSLEVLMNDSILRNERTFLSIKVPNLYATPKYEKGDFWKGYWSDYTMVFNIIRAYSLHGYVLQFLKMVYLNAKYQRQFRNYDDKKEV